MRQASSSVGRGDGEAGDAAADAASQGLEASLVHGSRHLDSLSFLFASSPPEYAPEEGSTSVTATKPVAEDALDEVCRLLSLKKDIHNLMQENAKYIESLLGALGAAMAVDSDLDQMERCLERAHEAEQQDSITAMLPTHAERIHLPLFPRIYRQVPLLASQSDEVELLRLLVSKYPWLREESKRLCKSVLAQCKRIVTLQLASSDQCPTDLFDLAASWSDADLAAVSLPSEGEEEGIDWWEVADEVGGSHTAEDCRTRWLMVDRPGLKEEEWTSEEEEQLQSILDDHVRRSDDGIVRDWEAVAKQLNSGRLAIDCFALSQQQDMVATYASSSVRAWEGLPMSEKEEEVLGEQNSIWSHHHAIVCDRLATSRPRQQVPIAVSPPTFTKNKWSDRSDNSIISHVTNQCHMKRKTIFEKGDSIGPIDFSVPFRGRPAWASDKAIKKRWNVIKAEHRSDPTRYIRVRQPKESKDSAIEAEEERQSTPLRHSRQAARGVGKEKGEGSGKRRRRGGEEEEGEGEGEAG